MVFEVETSSPGTMVYLGVGSNVNRHHHIGLALNMLDEMLTDMCCSPVYECAAVGFDGRPFFNLVVAGCYQGTLKELYACLKAVERKNGRVDGEVRFSDKTLDIDILLFGGCVGVVEGICLPRPELFEQSYVLLPMSELAPAHKDPLSGETFAHLWQFFPGERNTVLGRVDVEWPGKPMS